jgi:hypothetical protein
VLTVVSRYEASTVVGLTVSGDDGVNVNAVAKAAASKIKADFFKMGSSFFDHITTSYIE